jgi:sulfite oxidase
VIHITGGAVILQATGGAIDAYWDSSNIHQKQDVYDILEQYFIGLIDDRDLVDGKLPQGQIDDPFSTDPERDQALIVHTERPCNAETPAMDLNTLITPTDKHYVRNHFWYVQHARLLNDSC